MSTNPPSVTTKAFMIGIMAILLLIPVLLVQMVIGDRANRRDAVVNDIAATWGRAQQLAGPVLMVPGQRQVRQSDGSLRSQSYVSYFLPKTLDINAGVEPQVRSRSLYQTVVYSTPLTLSGRFDLDELARHLADDPGLMPQKAELLMGISDMKGVQSSLALTLDGKPQTLEPGMRSDFLGSGVAASVNLNRSGTLPFSVTVSLRGSARLSFVPVGETTKVHVASSWPSPSFDGAFLPSERQVSGKGFSADWQVLHFNRDYPQFFEQGLYHSEGSEFGVSFLVTADSYQQAMRISKYAILVIALTFMTFFFVEALLKSRVHPLQYLLIGLALGIFYILLLAFSEHTGFGVAYLVASVATIGLIGSYSLAVLKSRKLALLVMGILTLLYGYIYVILQLEDLALLMGAMGLFAVLALVMYLTRNLDWYGLDGKA
ncbi:MAG: cell envelope integrity protein CreD [Pseudomonadota bacterium]|uniref:cell envelope integrity protein CreD n=1 Tax=Gallaecimonas pentaromativorans TaxID=584787 RepID=UPI00067F3FC0|nr:cell envelope integrity protein CreD [Gallaecimonas pentaromativorans]MED5526067.1 cell envelope integrity protein CreD [Pseudomonadota bacterium]